MLTMLMANLRDHLQPALQEGREAACLIGCRVRVKGQGLGLEVRVGGSVKEKVLYVSVVQNQKLGREGELFMKPVQL